MSLQANSLFMKRKTESKIVLFSIRMEVRRVVRVKAYKRVRNGKTEKVRGYYRGY